MSGPVAVPLFFQTEGIESRGAIHRQHAVKVIDLVLQQLSQVAFGIDYVLAAGKILITNPYLIGAGNPDHQIGKRETVIPHRKVRVSDIHYLRVHQRPRTINLDVDHTNRGPDLGCGDPPPVTVTGLKVAQRFPQFVGYYLDGKGAGPGNRSALGPENRVAQQPYPMDSHKPNVRFDVTRVKTSR